MKSVIWVLFENLSRSFKFLWNMTGITGTLDEYRCMFMIVCRSFLLRMRNCLPKTHILCSVIFVRNACLLWGNVEKCGRARQATDGKITRRMRIACWVPKATNPHSEYVIPTAFPLQQWLHERPSVLRYTYIVCLVTNFIMLALAQFFYAYRGLEYRHFPKSFL